MCTAVSNDMSNDKGPGPYHGTEQQQDDDDESISLIY